MTGLLPALLAVLTVNPAGQAGESHSLSIPCTLSVPRCLLILPVREAHWNMNPGEGPSGLGIDTLGFTVRDVEPGRYIFPEGETSFPKWERSICQGTLHCGPGTH